jgi:hypothetical protein
MSVCCGLIRLSDRNIEAMIQQPSLVHSLLRQHTESSHPSTGLLARLFARAISSTAPREPAPLPDPREAGDECGVDKAWHAIHYLLTGTGEPTDNLLGLMYSSGTPIKGTDFGLGPPRVFTNTQVASIVSELATLDRAILHSRYKPKEMDDQDVYPHIWERDGDVGFDYIWQQFESFRALLSEAHRRKQGLFVYHD